MASVIDQLTRQTPSGFLASGAPALRPGLRLFTRFRYPKGNSTASPRPSASPIAEYTALNTRTEADRAVPAPLSFRAMHRWSCATPAATTSTRSRWSRNNLPELMNRLPKSSSGRITASRKLDRNPDVGIARRFPSRSAPTSLPSNKLPKRCPNLGPKKFCARMIRFAVHSRE